MAAAAANKATSFDDRGEMLGQVSEVIVSQVIVVASHVSCHVLYTQIIS